MNCGICQFSDAESSLAFSMLPSATINSDLVPSWKIFLLLVFHNLYFDLSLKIFVQSALRSIVEV